MGAENRKPYVVSSDVSGLMQTWAKNTDYSSPSKEYLTGMNNELSNVLEEVFDGSEVDIVTHEEIKEGMLDLMSNNPYPSVILDRAYFDEEPEDAVGFIDATRVVSEEFEDLGLQPRPGTPSLESQYDAIASAGIREVILVDDVLFTGSSIIKISEGLAKRGCEVKGMVAGIAVKDGRDKLSEFGIETASVYAYEAVIDEVCERDFRVGVPMSGRTLIDKDGKSWSAPYIKPFGNPENWASIPFEAVDEFSEFLIRQSISLWQQVEKVSKESIPADALPRKVKALNGNKSIIHSLKGYLRKIK